MSFKVFDRLFSSQNYLPPEDSIDCAKLHLESARTQKRREMALVLCNEATKVLSSLSKTVKKSKLPQDVSNRALHDEIALVYFQIGEVLDSFEYRSQAKHSYQKVAKWGGRIQEGQLILSTGPYKSGDSVKDIKIPLVSLDTQSSSPLLSQISPVDKTTLGFPPIFTTDAHPSFSERSLPKAGEALGDIVQLTYSLSLLQSPPLSEERLGRTAYDWLKDTRADPSEQERLRLMATSVVMALEQNDLKNPGTVGEVVFLAPVLSKDDYRNLLGRLVDGFNQSYLLDSTLLEGLAQLIQGANEGYLGADDLVKILGLISRRLQETHEQSAEHIYQLTQAASNVLDAMADSKVTGLNHDQLHEPLLIYLDELQSSSDPYLVYQAAYAFQALQYVPDDKKPWETALWRGGKVLSGIFGLVSAVKALDVNEFIEGLGKIQEGVAGLGAFFCAANDAINGIVLIAESEKTLSSSLKEVIRFNRKRKWYTVLRGADALLQNGEVLEFQRVLYEAPCRLDPAFQWGVCERLGKLAANSMWNVTIRQQAVVFLGEIYRNDAVWGQQLKIKEWILDILAQLSNPTTTSENNIQVMISSKKILDELKEDGDDKKQAHFRSWQEKGNGRHPLKNTSLPLAKASSSLLDRVQHKAAYMADVLRLMQRRLDMPVDSIYIPPLAKSGPKVPNDPAYLFPLMDKVKESLDKDSKVLLVLGDLGVGKSTFNRVLERDLWSNFKKNYTPIPLYIHLPAIEKPEHDLIAKQLAREHFNKDQIKEMRQCDFILICDGYDESKQSNNLYRTNQFNKPGQWRAQMVVSCRTEYIDLDYLESFHPEDRSRNNSSTQFQEAVIAPFSINQIKDYISQYVSVEQRPWDLEKYLQIFKDNPQLFELVKSPILLALSMEVLPSMVSSGQELNSASITRLSIYDQFVDLRLNHGKTRLRTKTLSEQESKILRRLAKDDLKQQAVKFLKDMSVSVFEKQNGNPQVEYLYFRDKGTWKEDYFSDREEAQFLRELCPLSNNGNTYRFIHRSMMEYGVARSVFESNESTSDLEQSSRQLRRGSVDSISSVESQLSLKKVAVNPGKSLVDTPLGRNILVDEPSILQFLEGKAQQSPIFKDQLFAVIEQSKTEKAASKAAANAITILIRIGVRFNEVDLRGIQIPRADLTGGEFDSAQLQGADLRRVNLSNTWLSRADLSGARMGGVQFGELPYLKFSDRSLTCAYSKDEKLLASGVNGDCGLFACIKVYSTSTWEEVVTLTCNSEMVFSISFSPNANHIASCFEKKAIQIWEVETGACFKVLGSPSDLAMSVIYSPGGDHIASGRRDGTVQLWNVETEECDQSLFGHTGEVPGLDYSPDGGRLVSGGSDNTVRVWDIKTGECYHIFEGHSGPVNSVAFIASGRIASGSDDYSIRIWNVETKFCQHTLQGHNESVRCIAFLSELNQIVSGSIDKTLRLWDADTGTCSQVLSGHTDWIMGVAYSRKRSQIASTSGDGTTRLWDIQAKASLSSLDALSGDVKHILILPECNYIVSCCSLDSVHLWDLESGEHRKTFRGYENIKGVRNSPNGIEVACYSNSQLTVWNTETGNCINTFHCDEYCLAFSPNWDKVAYPTESSVVLWDFKSDKSHQLCNDQENSTSCIAYSPKGSEIITGGDRGEVRVWDIATGECRHTLIGHKRQILSIAFSPNSDLIATGSQDNTVRIWDIRTGECLHTWSDHNERIMGITFSPKGDRVASGSDDMTVRIWNVETGQCNATIKDFHGEVISIVWKETPHGNFLVTGSRDRSTRSWKVTEDGDKTIARLRWSTTHDQLTVINTSLQNVEGLSPLNAQLLKQRGAIVDPQYY
ncbi:hypothetical protein BGZ49_008839 [Haplosporangium sp. Z 27]|nr:hypothetical protein BGZ49_008839 [Haplosporangium sp. Z 27]